MLCTPTAISPTANAENFSELETVEFVTYAAYYELPASSPSSTWYLDESVDFDQLAECMEMLDWVDIDETSLLLVESLKSYVESLKRSITFLEGNAASEEPCFLASRENVAELGEDLDAWPEPFPDEIVNFERFEIPVSELPDDFPGKNDGCYVAAEKRVYQVRADAHIYK